MPLTISIAVSAVLAVLLVERLLANRRMSRDVRMQQEMNFELLKRVPDSGEGGSGQAGPLTPEQIAEAIRKEGYIPEIDTDLVRFKIQGAPAFYLVVCIQIELTATLVFELLCGREVCIFRLSVKLAEDVLVQILGIVVVAPQVIKRMQPLVTGRFEL